MIDGSEKSNGTKKITFPGRPENLKPFPKGVSGNPGGKKPVDPEVKAIFLAATPAAARALVAIVKSNKAAARDRINAADIILNRVYGKAVQPIITNNGSGSAADLTDAQLRARLVQLGLCVDAEPVLLIDVTPAKEPENDQ